MSMASFESHSPVGSITNSIRRYSTPSALLGAQSSSFSESIHSAQPVTVLPEAEESLDPPGGSINSHSAADSLEPALSSSSHDAEVLQNEASLRGARVRHYLTLTMLCCSNISSAMYGSLLAPFFPTEAARKDVTQSTIIGFIFGCYPLVMFVFSPVFGQYMARIGPKFLFVAGNFVCSGCAILFGVLQWCPPGSVYVAMCFAVRIAEALAAAAKGTAAYTIAVHVMPSQVSTIMGLLQAASCLGLMAGPPIGGLLYAAAGYYLPFVVSGAVFMISSFISIFVLPAVTDAEACSSPAWWSTGQLLRSPLALAVGFIIASCQAAIGFLDVALALHLHQIKPGLSSVYVGLIFLIPAGIVVFLAPAYGILADKYKVLARPAILLGGTVAVFGFLGLGPSPLLPFLPQGKLWVVMVSLAVAGVGWGATVLTYEQLVIAARNQCMPDDLHTRGIVSGLNNSFNSLGAFLGPMVSGVMIDHIGFDWSATVVAGITALSLSLWGLFIVVSLCTKPLTEREDHTTLLHDEHPT